MADKDKLNVEFESVPEAAAEPVSSRAVPVEQKVINPPSGIAALIILIFLCLWYRCSSSAAQQHGAEAAYASFSPYCFASCFLSCSEDSAA